MSLYALFAQLSAQAHADAASRAERDRLSKYAMSLESGDRAYSQGKFNELLGFMQGYGNTGGSSSSASSGFGGMGGVEKRLADLLDNPGSIKETGAYDWRRKQGQQALERSMGAKGLLGSGNRLTELTKYGQDMASQEYENQFGRLSSLLGNYQQAQAGMFGSLAGALGNGAIGRGGATDAWGAYRSAPSSTKY